MEHHSHNFSHSRSRQIRAHRHPLRGWASRNNHDHTLHFDGRSRRHKRNRNNTNETHNSLAQVLHRVSCATMAGTQTSHSSNMQPNYGKSLKSALHLLYLKMDMETKIEDLSLKL